MKTQYGIINENQLDAYMSKLIGRVFKIIPMNEEQVSTLEAYVDSLLRELMGNSKLFLGEELLSVCGTLKGLDYSDHRLLKSDVFKAIELIEKARERVK
ncbi:hypothetical protein [Paenibacillus agilis]|uniref:Uncharacterized protein n=1 Tax=Paenibacillus agilis TaxID=3020863 RepID=A0A559IF23_9BACL|nr:hypothetical protein [Paenibacillus agilis]TVX86073.1 hypothetical protein FPZ44_24345 [Paenibacillus agilis]